MATQADLKPQVDRPHAGKPPNSPCRNPPFTERLQTFVISQLLKPIRPPRGEHMLSRCIFGQLDTK